MNYRKEKRTFALVFDAVLIAVCLMFACSVFFKTDKDKAFATENVYSIYSQSDFDEFISLAKENSDNDFSGYTVNLYCNVDASGWATVNLFGGNFNGNGFSLLSLNKNLFNTIQGTFRNVNIEKISIVGSFPVIANTNKGTVENVSITNTVRIENDNNGIIGTNSSSAVIDNLSVIHGVTSSASVGMVNMNYGTVRDSIFVGDMSGTNIVYPLVGYGNGTITRCAYNGNILTSGTAAFKVYPFGTGTTEFCAATVTTEGVVTYDDGNGSLFNIKSSYVSCGGVNYIFGSDGTLTENDTNDFSGLSGSFLMPSGFYPVPDGVFVGEGTSSSPFVTDDGFGAMKLSVLKKYDESATFYANFNNCLRADAEGKLFYVADGGSYADYASFKAAVTEIDLTNDGYAEGSFGTVSSSDVEGEGTVENPYTVTTAEELAGLLSDSGKNLSSKYAVITRDILVNTVNFHNRKLNVSAYDVNINLDGTNKRIVNVSETVFGKVIGTIKNLTVDLSVRENLQAGVCTEIAESGGISYVVVSSDNNGFIVGSGFTVKNNGSINLCENKVSAEYAFSSDVTETGRVENSSDKGVCLNMAGNSDGVDFCVSKNKAIVGGMVYESGTDVETLENLGFDMENVFGYEKYEEIDVPSVRKSYGEYRVKALSVIQVNCYPERVRNLQASAVFNKDSTVMTLLEPYPTSFINNAICAAPNAEFIWTYKSDTGEVRNVTKLIEVGEYSLKVVLHAGNDYLPAEKDIRFELTKEEQSKIDIGLDVPYTYTFRIEKTVFKDGLTMSSFSDVTEKYFYTGESISFGEDEPVPDNIGKLTAAGFVYNYGYSASPFDSGNYLQTIFAESPYFISLSKSRNIVVNKAELKGTIDDISLDYNENIDFTKVNIKVNSEADRPLGADSAKSILALIAESGFDIGDIFLTDYVRGSNVGEYALNCAINEIKNYKIDVTEGKITVNAIPLPLTGIEFSGGNFDYDGLSHSIEIGSLPDGYTVTYSGNEKVDAGTYLVTAVLSCAPNYADNTLTAYITINKAELTVAVGSLTKKYGYAIANSDFSFNVTGFVGNDTEETVLSEIRIELCAEEFEDGEVPDAGKYRIISVLSEEETANYVIRKVNGLLTIEKIPLSGMEIIGGGTSVYDGNKHTCSVLVPEGYSVDTEFIYEDASGNSYDGGVTDVGVYKVTAVITPIGNTAINYLSVNLYETVKIDKITVRIIFDNPDGYAAVYNGENHAKKENFPFGAYGADAEEITVTFETTAGMTVEEAVSAGKYYAVASFAGDGNRTACTVKSLLTVQKKEAAVDMETQYEYTSEGIPMTIKSIEFDNGGEPLVESNLFFVYVNNEYGNELPQGTMIISVGVYTVTVKSNDSNYYVSSDPFTVTVTPKDIDIELGIFTMDYGTTGDYTDEEGHSVIVYDSYFVYEITVPQTEKTQEIRVILPKNESKKYTQAGEYTIDDSSVYKTKNYNINLIGVNKIVIKRRKLNVYWCRKNTMVNGYESQTVYSGNDITDDISYEIGNYAFGEGLAYISIVKTIKKNAQDTLIKDAGKYRISLSLKNTPNYDINAETASFVYTVKQSNVFVQVENCEVRYKESLRFPTITVTGLLGEDIGQNPTYLSGYDCEIICDYKPGAAVGTTYSITGVYAFTNYEVASVSPGRLTVVEGYPSYVLTSAIYVYDGTPKSLVLPDVAEGIQIKTSLNAFVNVGEYTVTAVVTYPTGRAETLSAKLTIVKATPTIDCPVKYVVFKAGTFLTEKDIVAEAYSSGNKVSGTFSLLSTNTSVKAGLNGYSVKFTPNDLNNYTVAGTMMNVVAYEINAGNLRFEGDYGFSSDGKILLKNPSQITLDTTSCPEIADKLSLWYNGNKVSVIYVKSTEKFVVSIKFDGAEVYSSVYDVIVGKIDEEKQESVEINHKMLSVHGINFNGSEIIVADGGGQISMGEKFSADYALYINGNIISGAYTISSADKEIGIIIVNKKLGISMYSKVFTVISQEEAEIRDEQKEEAEESGFKTYYYYIIGGVGGLLLVGGAVFLILMLKKRK